MISKKLEANTISQKLCSAVSNPLREEKHKITVQFQESNLTQQRKHSYMNKSEENFPEEKQEINVSNDHLSHQNCKNEANQKTSTAPALKVYLKQKSVSCDQRRHSSIEDTTKCNVSIKHTVIRNAITQKALVLSRALGFHCVLFCVVLMCYFFFGEPSTKYYQFLSACLVVADVLCIHLWILRYIAGGNLISRWF